MSCGKCNQHTLNSTYDIDTSNNILMFNSREFTDWQPGAQISNNIRKSANIHTNAEYREYMINNADSIIKYNQELACNQCCLCPATYGYNVPEPNVPYLYKNCLDTNHPFGYETSDLKQSYLTSIELQNRMNIPTITQAEILQNRYPNFN